MKNGEKWHCFQTRSLRCRHREYSMLYLLVRERPCVGEEFRSSALNITSMFSINNLSFVCNKTQNKRYSGTTAPLYRNYEHEKSFELHLRQNILYWHKHSRSVSRRISSDHHIAECESLFFHHMDIFLGNRFIHTQYIHTSLPIHRKMKSVRIPLSIVCLICKCCMLL